MDDEEINALSAYNAALREIDPILEEINRAMSKCVQAGVEPRELWLGPDEWKRFENYIDGIPQRAFDIREVYLPRPRYQFQGMQVVPMLPPGVRVGSSFSK